MLSFFYEDPTGEETVILSRTQGIISEYLLCSRIADCISGITNFALRFTVSLEDHAYDSLELRARHLGTVLTTRLSSRDYCASRQYRKVKKRCKKCNFPDFPACHFATLKMAASMRLACAASVPGSLLRAEFPPRPPILRSL